MVDAQVPSEAGELFAEDDFVVFWGGGFNTWCDIEVLAEGLDLAMQENPKIHFLSTGGAIQGHDSQSYARFKQLVAKSRYPERFVLKGTLPKTEADAWSKRADVGVVTEKRMAERELGSSGRILNWLTQGIPVVCTSLSELGEALEAEGGALTYRVADGVDLARILVEVSRDPESLRLISKRGRELSDSIWSAEFTTRPLREWLRQPQRAPGAELENPVFDVDLLAVKDRLEMEKGQLESEVEGGAQQASAQAERIRQLEDDLARLETERDYYRSSAADWQRQWRESNS